MKLMCGLSEVRTITFCGTLEIYPDYLNFMQSIRRAARIGQAVVLINGGEKATRLRDHVMNLQLEVSWRGVRPDSIAS